MVGGFIDYMDENGNNNNQITTSPEFFIEGIELCSSDEKHFDHPLEGDSKEQEQKKFF